MSGRPTPVFLFVVVAVSVLGYLVGLRDGVPKPNGLDGPPLVATPESAATEDTPKLVPSISYAEVLTTAMGPTSNRKAVAHSLPQPPYDLYQRVEPSEAEKLASTEQRASRRAFNGAPPMIPHAVENTSDSACYICHARGVEIAGRQGSVMSHAFLSNCMQCHAPPAPIPFQSIEATVDSSFVGLPAPTKGERAFPGAPPTIPHSRWMRENCNACHGGPHGWAGMESTHPWRTNCTQCHAPSATLDQMPTPVEVPMLPPLDIVSN